MSDTLSWMLRHYDGIAHGPYTLASLVQAASIGNIAEDSELMHPQHTGGRWLRAIRVRPILEAMPVAEVPPVAQPVATDLADDTDQVQSINIDTAKNLSGRRASRRASWFDKLKPGYLFPNLEARAAKVANIAFCVYAASVFTAFGVAAIGLCVAVFSDEGLGISHVVSAMLIPIFLPVFCLSAVSIYALPTIVAYCRYHTNWLPIGVVNLFAAWSGLGWVLLVAWSLGSTVASPEDSETQR